MSLWAVVKASALARLGKPLLRWYAGLLVVGLLIVAASLAWMYRP
jgi:hypothetical protein